MTHNTREERELLRLASLVGTDAKSPEEKLLAYVHHQLQKARQDWLREEMVRLKKEWKIVKYSDLENLTIEEEQELVNYQRSYNQALQTIIDRYQKELDQDNTKGLPDTK